MDERHGFLNALLANPGDVTAYLVYADWLEERGDPRGELMRAAAARVAAPRGEAGRAEPDVRIGRWVAAHSAAFLGPLAGALGVGFGLLDAGRAWLLFLHADLPPCGGQDPLPAQSRLRGTVKQDGAVFPTVIEIRGREGNLVQGRQECEFGHGTGKWSFSGVVLAGWFAYVTDRLSGSVTFPGLYQGKLTGQKVAGQWKVPSHGQGGKFAFTKEAGQ
jgi:uncharacterized protein (TIGR02996 family)